MATYLRTSYDVLSKIFREKSFSTETLYSALEGQDNAELVHRIVLGVLERNTELDYILSQLAPKLPKPAVAIIIKQGIYCLKYMNSLPDYAVINNSVELIKQLGKIPLAGFVNAVLKKAANGEYKLPEDDGGLLYLSIKYGYPAWIIEKFIKDFGRETALDIISEKAYSFTHIRPNARFIDLKQLENYLESQNISFFETQVGGVLTKVTPEIKKLFKEGKITYQSVTSILAADALLVKDGMRVLDLCSAPGGKAVYLAERYKNAEVIACDLYPHRVELIFAYAKRMRVKNVFPKECDATVFNPDFEGKFDRVLVDAPCSALGIIRKQPDVMLNRTPSDIKALQKTQADILHNAAKYVKTGGFLVYSTCTVTKEENDGNVDAFLKGNKNFVCDYRKQYLPKEETDGFFVARFKRV